MPWSADGTLEIVLIIISVAHPFYVCNFTGPTTPSVRMPAMDGT
jgi:hypothetical protein